MKERGNHLLKQRGDCHLPLQDPFQILLEFIPSSGLEESFFDQALNPELVYGDAVFPGADLRRKDIQQIGRHGSTNLSK